MPDWRANLLASYRWRDSWTATLGERYSGKHYNQLDNSDVNGASYMGLSDFLVLDARLRYRVTSQVTAALGVDNLDEKYWAYHPYAQRTYAAEVGVDF